MSSLQLPFVNTVKSGPGLTPVELYEPHVLKPLKWFEGSFFALEKHKVRVDKQHLSEFLLLLFFSLFLFI